MALQKAAYKSALKVGFIQALSNPKTQSNVDAIAEALADVIANAGDIFVKTGTVTGVTSNGGTITNLPIL